MSKNEERSSPSLGEIFQKIIAYQNTKNSDVWNEELGFDQRISSLPLISMQCNHPTKDPEIHGPTIAHYPPSKREIVAIAKTIKNYSPQARVLDIGCGNGFIGGLLAREGLNVIGIDDLTWNQPQVSNLYDGDVYCRKAPFSLENYTDKYDVAFCSWMVPGENLTNEILKSNPAIIIHVYSSHKDYKGELITGSKEAYNLPEGYSFLCEWESCTPSNFIPSLFSQISFYVSDQIIITSIWIRNNLSSVDAILPSTIDVESEYAWDIERNVINKRREELGLDQSKLVEKMCSPKD